VAVDRSQLPFPLCFLFLLLIKKKEEKSGRSAKSIRWLVKRERQGFAKMCTNYIRLPRLFVAGAFHSVRFTPPQFIILFWPAGILFKFRARSWNYTGVFTGLFGHFESVNRCVAFRKGPEDKTVADALLEKSLRLLNMPLV